MDIGVLSLCFGMYFFSLALQALIGWYKRLTFGLKVINHARNTYIRNQMLRKTVIMTLVIWETSLNLSHIPFHGNMVTICDTDSRVSYVHVNIAFMSKPHIGSNKGWQKY